MPDPFDLTDEDLELAEQINHDGYATVECGECGHFATVEPDADYPCPEPDCTGRLISPLREWGLI